MNANAQNDRRLLDARIASLEQVTRRIPSRFAGGGAATLPPIYIVLGGQTLTNFGIDGVVKITTVLDGSTLPAGVGGSPGDTVNVPAFPIPASLPNGIGVGRLRGSGAYAFLLNDSTGRYQEDLIQNQAAYTDGSVTLTKVAGGVNYTYVCQIVFLGL